MRKLYKLLLAILFCMVSVHAQSFEVNGLSFRVLDPDAKTVKVTYQGSDEMVNPYTQSSIVIPSTVEFNGNTYTVVEIGDYAFHNASLTSITIPSTVKTLGNGVFRYCNTIENIDLSSIETFGNSVFFCCEALTSVKLPETMTSIPPEMFSNCSNLKSFEFPKNINSIGYNAFSFTGLTSITIPETITSIDYAAFSGCTSIENVTIMSNCIWGNGMDGIFANCNSIKTIVCFTRNGFNFGFTEDVKETATVIVPESQVGNWKSLGFLNVKAADVNSVGGHVIDVSGGYYDANSYVVIGQIAINGKSSDAMYGQAFIVNPNTDVEVSFTPNSENAWELETATINGIDVTASLVDGKHTINSISGNQLVNATWKQGATYNVTYYANDYSCGSLYINGKELSMYSNTSAFPANKDITLVITPNAGYNISYFRIGMMDKKDELTANTDGTYSYTYNLSSDTNIEIGYEKPWKLTTTFNDGGTVTVAGEDVTSGTTKELTGAMVEVMIRPNTGYELASVLYNSKDVTATMLAPMADGFSIWPSSDQGDNQTLSITFQNEKASEMTDDQGVIYKLKKAADNSSYYAVKGYSNDINTEIVIPDEIDGCPVTSIESDAFRDCANLTSITIPNSVTSIGYSAFLNCYNLQLVTSKITNPFDVNAFDATISAALIVPKGSRSAYRNVSGWWFGLILEEGETNYAANITDAQGIVYRLRQAADNSFYYAVTGHTEDLEAEIVIPADIDGCPVKTIECLMAVGAFNGCKDLTSVKILGNQMTTIGEWAFYGCANLSIVKMGNSVRSIGEYAFSGCTSLTSITLPKNLESIGQYAFSGMMGGMMDSYCPITSINIPQSVKTIGSGAFQGCRDLTVVSFDTDVDGNSSLTSIGFGAFSNCALTSITIPNSVETIDNEAFSNNSNLTTVILGDGITEIKDKTFQNCQALTSVIIPEGVTSIGEYAFTSCALTSINLPPYLTTIGTGAFLYCPLKSINLPNSFTIIPDNIFDGNDFQYIKLGNKVKSIGKNAFGSREPVIEISTPKPPTIDKDAFPNVTYLSDLTVIVPNAAAETAYRKAPIWEDMIFANQENVTEVTVDTPGELSWELYDECNIQPAKVVGLKVNGTINADDFRQMLVNMKSLLRLDLSDCNITEIPDEALMGKTQLQELSLPAKLLTIGNRAFQDCPYLTGELDLPSTVTSIGESAFEGTNYTSVTMPYALNTIGEKAFYNVPITKKLTLPSKVTSVGAYAFAGTKINGLFIPDGMKSIGDYAFAETPIQDHVTIPDGVTSLGAGAFRNSQLPTVFLPNSITTLSEGLFQGCKNLNLVYVPDNFTSLSGSAFDGCDALEILRLSANLTSMGEYALQSTPLEYLKVPSQVEILSKGVLKNCKNLTSVSLPANLKTVDVEAFYGCTALRNLSVEAIEPPAIKNRSAIRGINTDLCIISIPTDSYKKYVLAEYWGQFVQMRNDIAVETEGDGEIAFESVEEEEEEVAEARAFAPRRIAARADRRAQLASEEESMTYANNGSSVYVPQQGKVRFYIIPAEGEELLSATLDDVDIMPYIVNNVYTATADKKNAKLVVKFSGSGPGNVGLAGDVNNDGKVDIADAVCIVNYKMDKPNTTFKLAAADVNNDGKVDITDAVEIVNLMVGK